MVFLNTKKHIFKLTKNVFCSTEVVRFFFFRRSIFLHFLILANHQLSFPYHGDKKKHFWDLGRRFHTHTHLLSVSHPLTLCLFLCVMPSHTYKYPGSLDLSTCDSLYISSFKTTLSHTYSLKYPRRLLVGIIVDFLSLSLRSADSIFLKAYKYTFKNILSPSFSRSLKHFPLFNTWSSSVTRATVLPIQQKARMLLRQTFKFIL